MLELDLTECPDLHTVDCCMNEIETIDLSACTNLAYLDCMLNRIETLDLTNCTALTDVYCRCNRLTRIELPAATHRVIAEPGGFVGLELRRGGAGALSGPGAETISGSVFSEPLEGWSFTGWYNGSGALISSNETVSIGSAPVIRAEFERSPGYLFGDADGNGTVDSTDALLILRYALGMISLDGSALALCDVDGNGTVDSADALLTLRLALGMTAL